ncbi:hypothetical protein K388_01715 [Streptomyces sp. KhCrAH-43]|nr:hypothetical protein K388_01715 [Streptomyces sp. KhCrAH-43]
MIPRPAVLPTMNTSGATVRFPYAIGAPLPYTKAVLLPYTKGAPSRTRKAPHNPSVTGRP